MAEQLKDCLIVRKQSISVKTFGVNGFGGDIPLWIWNTSDWIIRKKDISFWIKKASLWSRQTGNPMAIMIAGHWMAFRADLVNGAAGIFPPKIPNAPYHNGSWFPTGEGDWHTKYSLRKKGWFCIRINSTLRVWPARPVLPGLSAALRSHAVSWYGSVMFFLP